MPKGFTLSRTKLNKSWYHWVNGNSQFNEIEIKDGVEVLKSSPIRPLFLFEAKNLPCWRQFKSGWLGILKFMMKAPDLKEFGYEIKNGRSAIKIERVEETFEIGLKCVLAEVSYIKTKPNFRSWTTTTWSKKNHFSTVMLHGTLEDKDRLPETTRHNARHRGAKRKMKQSNSRVAYIRIRNII